LKEKLFYFDTTPVGKFYLFSLKNGQEFYLSSLKSFILRSTSVVLSCSANGDPAAFSGTDWSFGLPGTD
jgi:hypothetical protein